MDKYHPWDSRVSWPSGTCYPVEVKFSFLGQLSRIFAALLGLGKCPNSQKRSASGHSVPICKWRGVLPGIHPKETPKIASLLKAKGTSPCESEKSEASWQWKENILSESQHERGAREGGCFGKVLRHSEKAPGLESKESNTSSCAEDLTLTQRSDL